MFHQHDAAGGVLYRYPRVHYRRTENGAQLAGFGEGIEAITALSWPGLALQLGSQTITVLDAMCNFHHHQIRFADELIRYKFRSPWLPFNSETLRRYQGSPPAEKASERDRLARAALLVALKQLDIWVDGRVFAAVEVLRHETCRYKDVSMLGFNGTLFTNLDLPDGFAIGRAVSHGYGWIARKSSQRS